MRICLKLTGNMTKMEFLKKWLFEKLNAHKTLTNKH